MRNIDKIRKLKAKELSRFLNYSYTEPCESCGYHGMCDDNKQCNCYDGCTIWLKQKYNKKDKCWECLNEQGRT